MALDPNISLGVRPLQIPDPLAQMAQVSQIQAMQRQGEMSQMQLEDLKNDRMEMLTMQRKMQENGGSGDLSELAKTMLKTRKYFEAGVELTKKLKEQDTFETTAKQFYPELFGNTSTAAPATRMPAAPEAGSFAADVAARRGAAPVNALMPTAAPTVAPANALALNAAPAAAMPVNALAAPAAAPGKTVDQLRREMIMFSQSTDPRAKAMVDVLKNQLTELSKAQTLSPGQQLYAGGKVVYTAPEKDSEFEKLLKSSGLSDAEKTALRIARAKKEATHAPPVSVSMTQEKAESADYGKFLVEQFKNVTKSADLAQKSMPSIESNLNILDKGFDTGFGTETKAAGAKVLGALGVKDAEKYATDSQSFLSNASAAVLQKQLEQKGPQTEADAQRITQTGAQLGNTKDANKFVLNVAKAQLQRDIDQRNFYADWRKTNRTLDGAEDAWNAGPGSKSLFERPELRKYTAPTKANVNPASTTTRPPLESIFKPR
jgi:guanylate kinase